MLQPLAGLIGRLKNQQSGKCLGLNYIYGIWQADPVIGLLIAAVLVREGYEGLKEEKLYTCCGMSCEK